jgi:hypothetical protein
VSSNFGNTIFSGKQLKSVKKLKKKIIIPVFGIEQEKIMFEKNLPYFGKLYFNA